MVLKKCSMKDFSKRTQSKKIICFGAYIMPTCMCKNYPELHLEERIAFLVDNDPKKQGQEFDLLGDHKKILSPDELPRTADTDTVILITSMYYAAIIEQLEKYPALKHTECYVYPLIQALYPSYENITIRNTAVPLIPKKIHYFWVGGNEKPDLVKRCIDSWHKFCPDYEITEWNETNFNINKNRFAKEAYQAKKWGFVPDFCRLDVIYNYGGIYLDTDVELIKPLDDLLYNESYFGRGNYGRIATGLGFGAVKGSKIIKELLELYDNISFYKDDGTINLSTNTMREEPAFVKRGFSYVDKFEMIGQTVVFPSNVFSPNVQGTDIVNITENTYSIHHYHFSWANDAERAEYEDSIQKTKEIIAKMSEA